MDLKRKKLCGIYTMGFYSAIKNELPIHHRHGWMFSVYQQVKEVNVKDYAHYDSNYISFWKKQNYRDNKKNMCVKGIEVKGKNWKRRTQGTFRQVKVFSMMGNCSYLTLGLSQTHCKLMYKKLKNII